MTAIKAVKLLHPKSPEIKYTGGEPEWRLQPDNEQRNVALIAAFSWYNYHYGKKDAKIFVLDWLSRHGRSQDAKIYGRLPDASVNLQAAWLCRMSVVGLQLTDREQMHLNQHIADQIHLIHSVKDTTESSEPTASRVTIQDRLRERLTEAAGEIEGMYDDMIRSGARMSADYKPMAVLRGVNVAPQLVNEISDAWKRRIDELELVSSGRDAQMVEAYGNFGKIQIRNLIKFAEQVVADCASYRQVKKVERKPRAKKPVSPEKLTARFKYLKEFAELKLRSEPVTKLVNSSEAWFYDTKKRKLIHVVADSHVGSISVKGSALVGFDTTNSTQKTLRRPQEQLEALMSASAAAARKLFKDIRATDVKFNGRGSENLIILKAR